MVNIEWPMACDQAIRLEVPSRLIGPDRKGSTMSAPEFRNALAALLGSDLPECINRDDYLEDFEEFWQVNPARAFLRLSDDDQDKVWRAIMMEDVE
jgi:hypothetical protein